MSVDDTGNGGGNGAGNGALARDRIVLEYDPTTDQLQIGGTMFSLDRALASLERARRVLEQQWRMNELARQQQNAMENARVAAMLRNSRARG